LLASLLRTATEGSDIPPASVARELRRLQLFDGPTTWTLLRWEDLQADLVLAHADPAATEHLGDSLSAGDTGLFALQSPAAGSPPLTVRHAGELLDRPVTFTRTTIRFDGSKFTVEEETGTLPARRSRLLEPPPAEPTAVATATPPAEPPTTP
jgi:Ca-activated chloride channel homolog